MKGMHKSIVGAWGWAAVALLLPGLALASIGKVSVLEGTAKRTNGDETQAIEVGTEIELNDTIDVAPKSNLKITLNDESVIMLAQNSRLIIDEATFEGQDRKGFAARLDFGRVWARVKKALGGSGSKFEVQTERAVAGVRGTIFRVDYGNTAKGMMPTQKMRMVVRVVEGQVVVSQPSKQVAGQTPAGQDPKDPKKGQRVQVAAPHELTLSQWNQKFIELKANRQIAIEDKPGELGALDKKAMNDDFGQFVNRNQ